jgi:hypothetical protein
MIHLSNILTRAGCHFVENIQVMGIIFTAFLIVTAVHEATSPTSNNTVTLQSGAPF